MTFENIDGYSDVAMDLIEDKSFDCYTDSNYSHRETICSLKDYYLVLSRHAIVPS